MPRPIHLIFLASPLIVISSLASPSTVKKSSRRRWRLPSWTGSAQSASCVSVDVMSGDSVSASSGTFGCSLSVRVIICVAGATSLLPRRRERARSPPGSSRTTSCRPSGTAGGCTPRSVRRTRGGRRTPCPRSPRESRPLRRRSRHPSTRNAGRRTASRHSRVSPDRSSRPRRRQRRDVPFARGRARVPAPPR